MVVKLISYTTNPTQTCAVAANCCVNETPKTEFDFEEAEKLVKRVLSYGHESVAEMASFTFLIKQISRVCSHQLVRHRHFSYAQRSQRYVKNIDGINDSCIETYAGYIYPESVMKNRTLIAKYNNALTSCSAIYDDLISQGVTPEDARFVLPNASTTNIVMSGNARAWREMLRKRLCVKTQWEFRELAKEIHRQLNEISPALFFDCGPNCTSCKEPKSCNKEVCHD